MFSQQQTCQTRRRRPKKQSHWAECQPAVCCVLDWQHSAGCCQAAASAGSQLPAPPAPARTRLLRLRALRTHPCGFVAQGWEVDEGWSSPSIGRAFNAHVRTCVLRQRYTMVYRVRVPPSFSTCYKSKIIHMRGVHTEQRHDSRAGYEQTREIDETDSGCTACSTHPHTRQT